jgi:hypothetical protein
VIIGTIVKSNSHTSYLCRVYGKLETDDVPQASQYALGAFLSLVPNEGADFRLIGVVRDTVLLNPEYGNHGPRLSPDHELAVFSPDYLNEKGVLVETLVLGWKADGCQHQTIPALSAQVGSRVETMESGEVIDFHRDPQGKFVIAYLPRLLARNDPTAAALLLDTLDRLAPVFPKQQGVIDVLKNNLAWKSHVVPAG